MFGRKGCNFPLKHLLNKTIEIMQYVGTGCGRVCAGLVGPTSLSGEAQFTKHRSTVEEQYSRMTNKNK